MAVLAILFSLIPATAGGCSPSPLRVRVNARFSRAEPAPALIALAQRYRICVGIEGTVGMEPLLDMNSSNITFGDFVKRAAPRYRVAVDGAVVHLRREPYDIPTWLDVPVDLRTDRNLDIMFVSRVSLLGGLLARTDPGRAIAGDILGQHEQAGPYDIRNTPVRSILDRLVSDLRKGGAWFAPGVYPKKGRPSSGIWYVLPYSDSLKDNLAYLTWASGIQSDELRSLTR